MRRALALACLASIAVTVGGCNRASLDPPPRNFMQGGASFPAATGYWFHQYAESEEISRVMEGAGFTCEKFGSGGTGRLRCERGFRLPGGLLSRTNVAELSFRRNGAVASAEASCTFAFFDSPKLSGTCKPFAARGAVYPNVEAFAAMAESMLKPLPLQQQISMFRLQAGPLVPLADAHAASDLLSRWRFECEPPQHHYTPGFRGNVGEIHEMRCQQWSLRVLPDKPQSQQVVVRYDSVDLAVLGVAVKLDDASLPLSPSLNTVREASARGAERERAPGAPTSLTLESTNGERFEVTWNSIGTGSRQVTLETFPTLTPESQRALVQAYIDKQAKQWDGKVDRLSHANMLALEWYGPEALPHIEALMSDERPEVNAALVKYMCFDVPLRNETSFDADRVAAVVSACIDGRRPAMPRTLEAMDRLLAGDMRVLSKMNGRSLSALYDFKRDVIYVYALGRDGKASAAALEELVSGKESALDPALARLVASALAQRDRPAIAR